MRQVIQNYKTGELSVVDVPPPALKPGCVLVRNAASLVSAGMQKHMLEMAKKSLVGKALARPDLVRQVITQAKAEGVLETYRQAMNRWDNARTFGVLLRRGGMSGGPFPHSDGPRRCGTCPSLGALGSGAGRSARLRKVPPAPFAEGVG